MDEQQPEGSRSDDERAELRMVAMRSLVTNMIGLGLQVGIIVAISKRDWLARQARRYRWYLRQEWRGARERALIAELHRDLSEIEHGSRAAWPPEQQAGGMYGG